MSLAPALNKTEWERIKQFDPALDIEWDNKIDRWKLYRFSKKGKTFEKRDKKGRVYILTLQNKDGSYRPLDGRLYHYLRKIDTWQYKNADAMEREWRQWEEEQERKEDERLTDDLIERGKYMRKATARILDSA